MSGLVNFVYTPSESPPENLGGIKLHNLVYTMGVKGYDMRTELYGVFWFPFSLVGLSAAPFFTMLQVLTYFQHCKVNHSMQRVGAADSDANFFHTFYSL